MRWYDTKYCCFCVGISPDGTRILTGSYDQTARVWDAEKGTEVLTLRGHAGPVYSVAFSPDGKRIASGSHDKTVTIWGHDGVPIASYDLGVGRVNSLAFSPDGCRLVIGGDEGFLAIDVD